MFQIILSAWAIGLGLATGVLAAFSVNSYRFKAEIKEGSATFYAYTSYAVLMGLFSLLHGGFSVPVAYLTSTLVIALLLSYLESPSGEPIVSKKVIESSPVQFLYLGRVFVILGKEDLKGTEDS
jgi:hypothetical protein